MFDDLTSVQWLEYNAKLQQKKNALRLDLKERGVLQKGGKNKFDNYKYFSEAQYKLLFTELLSQHGLELSFTEVDYIPYEGTEKQSNGRIVKLEFYLTDIETGFYNCHVVSGEGLDKGDKAGYKAYTGALKYFLANTFMVATGDDAEGDSPAVRTPVIKYATEIEKKTLSQTCDKLGLSVNEVLLQTGWKRGHKVTADQYGAALNIIRGLQDGR